MHSRSSRLITLLVILICLPLQGLAAVVMPACQAHGQMVEMHAEATPTQADGCTHHIASTGMDGSPNDQAPHSMPSSCNTCFYCYLSATQAVPLPPLAVDVIGVAVMVAAPLAGIPDAPPSPLYHPPRPTFAWC